jgi:hypothetical protein
VQHTITSSGVSKPYAVLHNEISGFYVNIPSRMSRNYYGILCAV